ncbi:MAG: hypothetical protein JWM68_228 [Verrucomicrobiales bacterium]|nr:hypothetical protein [Verrucomicrobiales bacterium]
MSTEKTEKGPTSTETLLGGIDVLVSFKEQSAASEPVKVLQLPVSSFPKLMAQMDDEVETIAIFTGKTRAWADSISMESHEAIIIEGERINGDFFGRWAARRVARVERSLPGAMDKLMTQASQNSSPKPQ